MNKKQQFLTEVQTAIIIWYVSKDRNRPADAMGAMLRALMDLDEAHYAATRIPPNMSANEAACKFVEFRFEQNKEPGYKPASWMMRG
ncbi:MAG: hypothetical protein ABSH34_35805 [Verrucomicrobiota bacterium]|jgi:hypothetical protein